MMTKMKGLQGDSLRERLMMTDRRRQTDNGQTDGLPCKGLTIWGSTDQMDHNDSRGQLEKKRGGPVDRRQGGAEFSAREG